MSFDRRRVMTDRNDKEVGAYRLKVCGWRPVAYLTAQVNGESVVCTTIQQLCQCTPACHIFIHDPPLEEVPDSLEHLKEDILVEGSCTGKNYNFIMGDAKIAEVVRTTSQVLDSTIKIGSNVDMGFISLCSFAIDEMYRQGAKAQAAS